MRIEHLDSRRIPELRQLWQQVFGDTDAFLDSFFRTAYAPDRCRCILIEDKIAAVLYWMDCSAQGQKLAYLYAVATHPDHRGKGLCRRLMADTHDHLRRCGYAGTVLVPQDAGLRTMYQKMGYTDAGGLRAISCAAGDPPLSLRAVGPACFARLRRMLLPENGVLQEGPSLAFLAEQVQFYAGGDFLLAGIGEGDTFFGTELLGNPQAAPGILTALGYAKGTFRIPGKSPFAMFHPLTGSARTPSYLGFAFD